MKNDIYIYKGSCNTLTLNKEYKCLVEGAYNGKFTILIENDNGSMFNYYKDFFISKIDERDRKLKQLLNNCD